MKRILPLWQRIALAAAMTATLGTALAVVIAPQTAALAQAKTTAKHQTAKNAPVKSRAEAGAANPETAKDPDKKGNPNPHRPVSKGGTKTRGEGDGILDLNNYSSHYVDAYVDYIYVGQIPPYGDLRFSCDTPKAHRLYAEQTYTSTTYGPRMIYIPEGGSFEWGLTN